MEEYPVKVYIYDVTKGMARGMSQMLIGRQLDGVWHTAIIVYGQEYFFGGMGISSCKVGGTILGPPDRQVELGFTQIPKEMYLEYLQDLSSSTFRPECYHLLDHNCNTFSNEVAQFLTGNSIPSYVTNLPHEVMSTPFGQMIRPFIDSMSVNPGGDSAKPLFSSSSSAAQSSSHGSSSSSSASKSLPTSSSTSSSQSQSQTQSSSAKSSGDTVLPQTSSKPTAVTKTPLKTKINPVTYKDNEIIKDYKNCDVLKTSITPADLSCLNEIIEFFMLTEQTWSLGPTHLSCLERLVSGAGLMEEHRSLMLRLTCQALLDEGVVGMAIHERGKSLQKLVSGWELLVPKLQQLIAQCLCNCSLHVAGRQWAVQGAVGDMVAGLCVHCVLHDSADLNSVGAALALNLTLSELNDGLASQLGFALVQLAMKLETNTNNTLLMHTFTALLHCMQSNDEVPALASAMGLSVEAHTEAQSTLCNSITTLMREVKL